MTQLAPAVQLRELEAVIERGLGTFVEVGFALLEIRDGRLYKETHRDFDTYCRERWGFSKRRANQLVEAAEVGTIVPTLPNEAQAREVSRVAKQHGEDAAREVWERASSNGTPTAASIRATADEVLVGDVVSESDDDPREVVAIEETPDERVFLDDSDEALVVGRETAVIISKPDLGGGVSHPARFTDQLLPVFAAALIGYDRVLDPFAGTGKIHELQRYGYQTVGVEIEPEWANLHQDTVVGDALSLPFADDEFDAVCTSPTYGNRLADHHEAADPESRRSYRHDLGRPLTGNNSGQLHWGNEYREFHQRAWKEAVRVLAPGGRFVLNIKDHIRNGERQHVSEWHAQALEELGLARLVPIEVKTPSLRSGSNSAARVDFEYVYVFAKDVR